MVWEVVLNLRTATAIGVQKVNVKLGHPGKRYPEAALEV